MVEIIIRKRQREEAVFTQRKFFKKTARGKVVKGARNTPLVCNRRSRLPQVIRERYLRDDVSCGIEKCRECISSPGSRLPFSGAANHKLFPNGHFVLPDTNVFLAQVCFPHRGETLL
jgi:exosome complex exonuclease DIS3/RRP44